MKSLRSKDIKIREAFLKTERRRLALKFVCNNMLISSNYRVFARKKLEGLAKGSSYAKARNRCVSSNRPKGVLRRFKLSRIKLREIFSFGLVPGVKKAVW